MIEMLSSVVNSLTYRVLSHLFFYIFVTFFSNLYILLWQKNMKFVDFFGEIWLNCGWYFLHSLLEHFLEKAYCLCSVWFPNQQKCVYFGIFLACVCTVLLWDFFTYFFELFIICFVHFVLQKSCVFMFFGKQ